MNDSTIGLVMGLGSNADYIKIIYNKDGKEASITITDGLLIFTENDLEYKNILSNEVKGIIANMEDEQRKLYGENPVGNIIRKWNGQFIQKYFNKETAKTYYVE